MSLNIVRVLALPGVLAANTIYLVTVSATELQVVTTGNTSEVVRKTLLKSEVQTMVDGVDERVDSLIGDIATYRVSDATNANTYAEQMRNEAITAAAADATTKADAAESDAIAAASTDATTKANAAQAAAIAAASTDATTKANAAQAAAISAASTDATTKANAAQAAAISAAAADATTKANAAQAAAISAAATDATTKANAAEADANAYTDIAKGQAIATAAADATTKANAAQSAAQAYTDSYVITAIGNLDLTNNAHLVANIAARDALQPSLTKSGFVLVTDATDDATVTLGAALYFFDIVGGTFTKVSEYESMDVIIPNRAILEEFSDVSNQLYYKGAAVGTVQAGSNEW